MKSNVKDELLASSSEESGSEDDEEAWKLTDEVKKEFFKTLSQIKSKDPKIYQKDVEFFKDIPIPEEKPKEKTKSRLTLRDYERKIVVEKGGELSDEEPPAKSMIQLSCVQDQTAFKNSLKALTQSDSEYESEAECSGFLKWKKTKTEEEDEEENYKEWLKGQKSEEAPDEEFLRDYVLKKRFLESDDKGDSGVDVGKLLDESENEEKSDKNHSHRYEEYIKRYPRVMGNTVRRKDDSRKRKREEVKERKLKEKENKKLVIKQKQKLKKQEIHQKLEELKQLTGNEKLAFENVLDEDFDIDEHDKAMQKLFNDEFYSQDDPNFNHDESSIHKDDWNEEEADVEEGGEGMDKNNEPQCEDPDFNMDCEYDPAAKIPKEKSSRSRRRKDKHRRATVSEAVSREKPVFDPATHKSFQEYVDQYYAIDCEDFIGDLPCRFKYRRTIPNSYGLTIEEILSADSKELDRWCSIRRIVQQKPSYKEKGDAMSFKRRAENEELKRKILPSLYKRPDEEKSASADLEDGVNVSDSTNKAGNKSVESSLTTKKKGRGIPCNTLVDKSKKRKFVPETTVSSSKRRKFAPDQENHQKLHKNNTVNKNVSNERSSLSGMSDARLQAYGIKPKKFRNKLKYNTADRNKNKTGNNLEIVSHNLKKKKMNKNHSDGHNLKKKKINENHSEGTKKKQLKSPQYSSNKSNTKKGVINKQTDGKKLSGWVVSKST